MNIHENIISNFCSGVAYFRVVSYQPREGWSWRQTWWL